MCVGVSETRPCQRSNLTGWSLCNTFCVHFQIRGHLQIGAPLCLCFAPSWEPSSWFRFSWPHLQVVPTSCPSWAKLPFLFFSKRHPTHMCLNHWVHQAWVWYEKMARAFFQDNWSTAPYRNTNTNTNISKMYCLMLVPTLDLIMQDVSALESPLKFEHSSATSAAAVGTSGMWRGWLDCAPWCQNGK